LLLAATPDAAISRVNTYDRDPVRTWGRGRVTLLGDAAHPMTFNVGQGACQAIEDAVELASVLAVGGEDVPTALRGYEALRLQRTATITRRARRIGAIGGWSSPIACGVRNRLLSVILPGPAARQAREVTSHLATVAPALSTPAHSLEELFRVNAH
jgi:2-polyprenyl-6-methoxyphenol hydroxylase-like FAD-dependent oxidoreductase